MKYTYISDFLKSSIVQARDNLLTVQSELGFDEELAEFRTIILNTPRRFGKTTALANLAKDYSALYITPTLLLADLAKHSYGVHTAITIDAARKKFLGYEGTDNLKYSLLLVDEFTSIPYKRLLELIYMLKRADLLSQDFLVVCVGTE